MTDIPPLGLDLLSDPSFAAAMDAGIAASIEAGERARRETEQAYREIATPHGDIADMPTLAEGGPGGAMHAASLQSWNALAARAGVPHVEADLVAILPMDDVCAYMDETLDPQSPSFEPFAKAIAHASARRYWRSDLCAGSSVKHQLSQTGRFEPDDFLDLCDPRIFDMHFGLPDIRILARPLLTPVRVDTASGSWPVEFRVFVGGDATTGAVSFYYPQAAYDPDVDLGGRTEEILAAADQVREMALRISRLRDELGILPWLPQGGADAGIGATIDFMLTEERGLVLIDAGPGYGFGAHPCCFIDVPVEGTRWALADGIEAR